MNRQQQLHHFINQQRSMQLATCSADGITEASYAPFVRHNGYWYIYISQLAQHTRNLLQHSPLSVLLIECESVADNIFARQRASFVMTYDIVSRETEEWQTVLSLFEQQHGEVTIILKSLPDFILFRLMPQKGQYVQGFAQAYQLTGDDLLSIGRRIQPKSTSSTNNA